jgi:DNA-nicking Smr family endonuclease
MGRFKNRQPGRTGRVKGMGRSIRQGDHEVEAHEPASGPRPPQIHLRQMTSAEALARLEMLVDSYRRRGERVILVVHGRGLRSTGGRQVLAPLVREWLKANPDRIADFRPAPNDWGGEGALVVTLRTES